MKVECPDAPHLHDWEEAAALLKISVEALKGAASHGRIPKTVRGRYVRFSDENIAQIIADGLTPPKAEEPPEREMRPRRGRRTTLTAIPGDLQPRPERAQRRRRKSA